jgi:hypothetical protein
MAVVVFDPLSAAPGYLKRPIDNHGKLRTIYGKMVAATLGDIGSTINMGVLPSGAVRLRFAGCSIVHSAWGAGALLNIGYAPYRYKQDQNAVGDGIDPGSANALGPAVDMSAASVARTAWQAALMKYDFYSVAGVSIIGTVAGAVVPAAATAEWWIEYVYE